MRRVLPAFAGAAGTYGHHRTREYVGILGHRGMTQIEAVVLHIRFAAWLNCETVWLFCAMPSSGVVTIVRPTLIQELCHATRQYNVPRGENRLRRAQRKRPGRCLCGL